MDALAVSYEAFIGQLLPKIKAKLGEGKLSKSIEVIFFEVLADLIKDNQSKYSYIKYINIWNIANKNSLGHIEFYAEFIHAEEDNKKINKESITNSRKKINANKYLFDKNKAYPISVLLRKAKIFGASFEYHLKNGAPMVMDNPYYITYNNNKFDSDPVLKEIRNKYFNKDENSRLDYWLELLRHCYIGTGDNLTHFFFFNGPIYYGKEQVLENYLLNYVLYANVGVQLDDNSKLIELQGFIRQFKRLIEQISFNLIVDIKDYQMRQTAVRASIAQVMARNMSHNLGSHVFSHLIKTEVYDELTDGNLKKLTKTKYSSCEDDKVFERQNSENPESPLKNQQLGYFNQYLKSRMDYLSEVTFGVPTMLTSKMIYNDVFKELDRVRLLLNYISGISEFKYGFDFQHNGESIMEGIEPDFAAAFPSDVLGCQAFYNIIENIIRNTAKHAKRTNNEKVTFTINFKDIDTSASPELKKIEGVDDLYCVEIDNGITENDIDELVRKQRGRINESVLDEYNQLRGSSLGLLEMEASAAFLRQIDIPEIESDDYNVDENEALYHERNGVKRLNILKPFKTTKGTLGYRFFMQKPKEFLFVGEWTVNKNLKKKLRNFGIEFISGKDFCTAMKAGKTFPHQFLLYNSCISKKAIKLLQHDNDCKTLLPLRKLEVDSNEVCKCWSNNKTDKQNNTTEVGGNIVLQKLKNYAWEMYYKKLELKDMAICLDPSNSNKTNQVSFLSHSYEKKFDQVQNWDMQQNPNTPQPYSWKIFLEKHKVFMENLSSRTQNKLPRFVELSKEMNNDASHDKEHERYVKHINNRNEPDFVCLRQELYEAYHNKVVVLDERIQKFAMDNSEGSLPEENQKKIPCWKLFWSTNVHIPLLPKNDCNDNIINTTHAYVFSLDPISSKGLKEKVESFINKEIDENAILLIHYGILERIYGGEKIIRSNLNAWAKKAKRVVVTSGRGAHSLTLPHSVCFANLSSVLYAFTENRNKFIINYLLHQARRKNE